MKRDEQKKQSPPEIQITGWRFCGDDDDSVAVELVANPDAYDFEAHMRDQYDLAESARDEDEPREIFQITDQQIHHGDIFEDEHGKPWRISFKRVRTPKPKIEHQASKDMVDAVKLGAVDSTYIIDEAKQVHAIFRPINLPPYPQGTYRAIIRKAMRQVGGDARWVAFRSDLKFDREYRITEVTFDQASGKLVQTTYRPD